MELKINYQYTYFVHPYVINENKYNKYIMKLLRDKRFDLKVFQRDKDLELYMYFSPKIREYMFSTFNFSKEKIRKMEGLPLETMAAILSGYPCTIFEYKLNEDIQGKAEDAKGIFFNIQKIELICFNTGICFLSIKTNIEDTSDFANILNFNYKFRDINQENNNLKSYDRIKVQTDSFENIKYFREFIQDVTGTNAETLRLDLDTERFLTYTYACIDKEYWNQNTDFRYVEPEYIKYANVLPNDNIADYNDTIKSISKWKYAKMGISKNTISLFCSSMDMNNYTVLPTEFENQYFYTYILNLYKRICLKRLDYKFKVEMEIKSVRKEFVNFTKNIWIQEITTDDTGTLINQEMCDALGLDKLYFEVKNKYDILYKELNIEKNAKSNLLIVIILLILLIINLMNFFALN